MCACEQKAYGHPQAKSSSMFSNPRQSLFNCEGEGMPGFPSGRLSARSNALTYRCIAAMYRWQEFLTVPLVSRPFTERVREGASTA